MATETQIMVAVDNLIRSYGTSFSVYKYSGSAEPSAGPQNPYNYKVKQYADPVEVTGRAIIEPTAELLSMIGKNLEYDAAFLWSRLELLTKFPTALENKWIDENDEVKFNDTLYKLIKIYPSGRIKNYCSLIIGVGKTHKGQVLNRP